MKANTSEAWLHAVLGPDRDPHAAERSARVAAAKYDAERVRRPRPAPTPAEAAPSVASARLRFCGSCSTARHTDAPACPCGGGELDHMNLSLAILLAGAAGMGVPAAGGEEPVAWLPPQLPSDQGLRWGSQAGRLRSAPSPGLADPAAKRRRKAQRAARREQRRRR